MRRIKSEASLSLTPKEYRERKEREHAAMHAQYQVNCTLTKYCSTACHQSETANNQSVENKASLGPEAGNFCGITTLH